jgi:hypothetical protein
MPSETIASKGVMRLERTPSLVPSVISLQSSIFFFFFLDEDDETAYASEAAYYAP